MEADHSDQVAAFEGKNVEAAVSKNETEMTEALSKALGSAQSKTALIHVRTLRNIRWRKYHKRQRRKRAIAVTIGIALLVFFVNWSLASLKRAYQEAFKWWNSPVRLDNVSWPAPEGSYPTVSMLSCAIGANYGPLGTFMALTFQAQRIPRSGAIFLLQFFGLFGLERQLSGIHWNGNREQLRGKYLNVFLPTNNIAIPASGQLNWNYIWVSWNALASDGKTPVNPFAGRLFPKADDFVNSPLINAYYDAEDPKVQSDAVALLTALFNNGFVGVAVEYMQEHSNAGAVIYNIVGGQRQDAPRPCGMDEKMADAISLGSAMMGGVLLASKGSRLLLSAGLGVGAGALAFGPLAGASCPADITGFRDMDLSVYNNARNNFESGQAHSVGYTPRSRINTGGVR